MAARPRRDPAAPMIRLAPTRSRRLMFPLVGGIMLVALCVAGGGLLWANYAQSRSVLVLAHDVPAGHVLVASDLVTRSISGDELAAVPASDESTVLGKAASVPLSAGGLLMPTQVGNQAAVPATDAVVATLMKPGQYPPSLEAGQRVELVLTPTIGAAAAPASGVPGVTPAAAPLIAFVVSLTPLPAGTGSGTVLTLRVPGDRAVEAAKLGASGSLSLVLRPAGS